MKLLRLGILAALLGLFVGCDEEDYLRQAYIDRCPEARTVHFDVLKPESTCRGLPIVFEMLNLNPSYNYDLLGAIDKFLSQHAIDMDVQDPTTGRTPLMTALLRGSNLSQVIARHMHKPNLLDKAGNHYLHYLAKVDVRYHDNWIVPGSDLEAKDASGLTPLQLAYQNGNWEMAWLLIQAGAHSEFLSRDPEALDPGFLFNDYADQAVGFLDSISTVLDKKFTGDYYPTYWARQNAFTRHLDHQSFADEIAPNLWVNIPKFLMRRGMLLDHPVTLEGWEPNHTRALLHTLLDDSGDYDTYAREKYRNGLKQNVATLFFHMSDGLRYSDPLWIHYARFEEFVQFAKAKGLLDEVDDLGLVPVFYWFSAPDVKQASGFLFRKAAAHRLAILLAATSNRMVFDLNHESLLSYAVMAGQYDYVAAVMESDPRMKNLIREPDFQGRTPLSLAQDRGFKDIYDYLARFR